MTSSIIDHLPPLYRSFLPAFFERQIPLEGVATCGKCVMLEQPGSASSGELSFSPQLKCCTHHPELPNYLVGALLSNSGPAFAEGIRRVREKIRSRIGITPLGIMRPGKYSLLIKNSLSEFFGRSETLICPYYEADKGICSVMPYRESVCSTWFCKYVSGADGKTFWSSTQRYLEGVEHVLKRYPLLLKGFDISYFDITSDIQEPLTVQELDDLPPLQGYYAALWGDWLGREEDFYLEAYRTVSSLNRNNFENIEGVVQKGLLQDVEKKYAAMMSAAIPERLRKSSELSQTRLSEDFYLLAAYSIYDPLKVSARLYNCLHYFDGTRSNSDALKIIQERLRVALSDKMIEKLYRFRILTAVPGPTAAG